MSETAATNSAPAVASESSAPVTETTAAPASAATDDAPPKEAGLEAHVQHAIKAGKRKEAAKTGAQTKAAKKAEAKPAPLGAPPPADTDEPDSGTETVAEVPARSGKTARQLLDEGDLDAAFEEAFGDKADAIKNKYAINSKRWAEYRQVQKRDREKIAARERDLQQNYAQYHQLIERAKEEVKPLIAMRKAKELYEGGDLEGAIKMAFGDDVSGFNKRLLGSFKDKNPEVDSVRAELQAMREERERERQQYAQQQAELQRQQQQQAFLQNMTTEIEGSGDPQLERFAKKPKFLGRVYQILEQHWDPHMGTTLPVLEAADMARREIVDEFGDVFGSRDAGAPAVSVRGGSNPAKPKTISQHGAAEVSAPQKGWHGKSLDDQVREFERMNGQAH